MYVCVCVHMCVYVCMYLCVCVCVYVHVDVCVCVYVHARACVCVYLLQHGHEFARHPNTYVTMCGRVQLQLHTCMILHV